MLPVAASALVGVVVRVTAVGLPNLAVVALAGAAVVLTHLVVVRIVSRDVLAGALAVLPIPDRLSAR